MADCKNPACVREIKTSIFKGEDYCSVNCQKVLNQLNGIPAATRAWNELNPHPTQLTELEKRLMELVGYYMAHSHESDHAAGFLSERDLAHFSSNTKVEICFHSDPWYTKVVLTDVKAQ